jgi:hypothetical protein
MMLKPWVSSMSLLWFLGIAQIPTDVSQVLGVLPWTASTVLAVPGGSNAYPTLDGRLNPGEWDDALRVSNGSLTLYLKSVLGAVYLAVDCPYSPNPGMDLFIYEEAGADIRQLQVRSDVRERTLPSLDPQRFAMNDGWVMPSGWAAATLAGDIPVPPVPIPGQAGLPSPGVEMKIETSKFPRKLWNMRLELSVAESIGRCLELPQQNDGEDGFRWLAIFISR